MADNPIIRVAAAIIIRDGRILACQRSDGQWSGSWEFPGGKVETGETPVEAVRREIAEELSCELGMCWLYDTVEYDYPDFHLSMDCFVATLRAGAEPTATEHASLRWVSRDELLDLTWLPADDGLVRSVGYNWDAVFGDMHL